MKGFSIAAGGPAADAIPELLANPHLTFGIGEHFCLGASLARLETRVLFEELLARWASYEVTDPGVRIPSTLMRQRRGLKAVLAP